MNKALWVAQKNELCVLIKQVSDYYGGDDVEWLREYARDVVKTHEDCLGKAIECFRSFGWRGRCKIEW